MPAANYPIYIEKNAYLQESFTYKIGASPVNLTGYTAQMDFKEDKDDSGTFLSISTDDYITLGGAAGTIVISVPVASLSGITATKGYYDLLLVNGSGVITRLFYGEVTIIDGITSYSG